MRLISHRGNTIGRDEEKENHPKKIDRVIGEGFDCEVDVWMVEDRFCLLGHDHPDHYIDTPWLIDRGDRLWIHAKNLSALLYLWDDARLNVFWQENDRFSMTSRGYIWTNVGEEVTDRSVLVMTTPSSPPPIAFGVCSDFVKYLR